MSLRRRWAGAVMTVSMTAAAAGVVSSYWTRESAPPVCHGMGDRLAQVWSPERRETIAAAFEATRIRGEQSDEVLGLRMACLDRRADELAALTTLFTQADGDVIDQASRAAHALTALEWKKANRPTDAPSLRSAQVVLARVKLEMGRPREALELIEAALPGELEREPGLVRSETLFLHARALWDAEADRARALKQAREVLEFY